MEIRKATKKDCDQLFELWKELEQTHSNYMNEENNNSVECNFYYELIDNRECYLIVAANKNEIVGYAECYIQKSQSNEAYLYILHAFVKQNYRRTKVAINIFNFIKDEAKKKGIHDVFTDVYFKNIEFYQSIRGLGFKPYKTKFKLEIE